MGEDLSLQSNPWPQNGVDFQRFLELEPILAIGKKIVRLDAERVSPSLEGIEPKMAGVVRFSRSSCMEGRNRLGDLRSVVLAGGRGGGLGRGWLHGVPRAASVRGPDALVG